MLTAMVVMLVGASSAECLEHDAARIQEHLLRTEADLRANAPAGLSAEQRAARLRNLDVLHTYAMRGVFPHNHDFDSLEPYFIDEHGTRCAMAQLIEQAGGVDFVHRIARERNNARVHEMLDEPELHAWLQANGMTVDEAARVQPTYFACRQVRALSLCYRGPETRLLRTTALVDGGVIAHVEATSGGDGGVGAGDDIFVPIGDYAYYLGTYLPLFESVDRRFVAGYYPGLAGLQTLLPVTDDGGIITASDRYCADRPSIAWAAFTALPPQAGGAADCIDALAMQDINWLQQMCWHDGRQIPDFCFPDGGYDPAVLPDGGLGVTWDAGVRDAGAERPIPDAGVRDAGAADSSVEDAGVADAGAPVPPLPPDGGTMMSADAGTVPMPEMPGCGCSSVSAPAVFLLLALLKRRRTYTSPERSDAVAESKERSLLPERHPSTPVLRTCAQDEGMGASPQEEGSRPSPAPQAQLTTC